MDLMALKEEPSPSAGQELGLRVLGRLEETTKVIPSTVEPLHRTYFRDGQVRAAPISWEVSSSTLGDGSRAVVASEMCQQLWYQPGCCGSLGLVLGGGFLHGSSHMDLHPFQVCEPLPSLPEVRTHAQVSLSLLSPAHRRLHEPQSYPVCPALPTSHSHTPRSATGFGGLSKATMDLLPDPSCSRSQVAVTERLHRLFLELRQGSH